MTITPRFEANIGADIRDFVKKMATIDKTIRNLATGVVVDISADISRFTSQAAAVRSTVADMARENPTVSINANSSDFTRAMNNVNRQSSTLSSKITEARIGANIGSFENKMIEVTRALTAANDTVTPEIRADISGFMTEITTVQSRMRDLARSTANPRVEADIAAFMAQMAAVQAELDTTIQRHDIDIDADTGGFFRGAARIKAQILEWNRERVVIPVTTRWDNYKNTMGQIANFSRSLGEIGAMTAGGIKIAMSPAIVPVLASVVGLVGQLGPMLGTVAGSTFALGSAFGTAGIGAAAFGAIAVTNLKDIFGVSEELKKMQEKLAAADTTKERTEILKEMKRVQGTLNEEQLKGLDAMNKLKSTWSGIAGALQSQTIEIFTSALSIMSKVLTDLKPMFSGVMDAAKNLTAALGASINAAPMQNFFNYLNTTAGPMLETIGKAVGNFVQGFLNMMTAFGPLATETAGSFLKMSESFAAWSASLSNNKQFQSFVAYVSENMPKIRSIFGDAMAGIINTFAAFAPSSAGMMTGLQNLMARFRAWSQTVAESQGFQNFVSYVQTNGPVVVSTIGSIITFITNLAVALAPLGAAMLGIINSFVSWTNSMMQSHPIIGKIVAGGLVLSGVMIAMMPHIIGLATLFVGLPLAMQTAVVGMVRTAAAFVTNWARIAVASTVNAAKVAAGWVLATGAQMARAVASMVTAAATFVARWVFMGAQALVQAARMAAAWVIAMGPIAWVTAGILAIAALVIANWDKISEWTKKTWSTVSKWVSDKWSEMKQKTTEAASNMGKTVSTKFAEIVNSVKEKMANAKTAIQTKWEEAKTATLTKIAAMVTAVGSKFAEIVTKVQTKMSDAKTALSNKWEEAKSATSAKLSALVTAVGTFFSNVVSTVRDKMAEAVVMVGSKVAEMPGKVLSFVGEMLSAGADLVRGLIDGIKNMGSSAIEAISGVVGGVISKAKSLLNINSPSRVFRDFGGFISEGLAIGVESKENAAVRAVANMASAMTDAFNPQFATAGVAVGDMRVAPMSIDRQMDNLHRDINVEASVNRSDSSGGGIVINNPTYNIEAKNVKEFNDVVRLFDKQRLRQQ